jgi:Flp pilus assembly secretin CpaC/tetratricopeptide (TPR) repeat protein
LFWIAIFFTALRVLLQQKGSFLAYYFTYFNMPFSRFAQIKVRYYRANAHSQNFLLQRNAFLCKIPIISQTIKRWLQLQIFCVKFVKKFLPRRVFLVRRRLILDKIRFLIESSGRKPLLVILVSLLLLTTSALSDVASSQPSKADKEKIVRQVAQKWIEVGAEQYKRGYFKAAKQSFLRAQDYQEYLTADEREKLNSLLEKTHKGILEREYILEAIRTADSLVKQGELGKAKAKLKEIKDSEFLTKTERELITKGLNKLGNQSGEQKKEIAELYNRSVEFYNAGQLEKAREGFVKVAASDLVAAPPGETAEDYLVKIDGILAKRAKPSAPTEAQPEDTLGATIASITKELVNGKKAEPNELNEVAERQVVQKPNGLVVAAVPEGEATEPVASKDTYIEVINRKRNIRQSHTRAVVNDAVAKVQNYISQDEFDKAKEEVERAERIVNEYQSDLGDELFRQHSGELKQLAEKIVQEQDKRVQHLQEQKRLEAIEAQRRDREQMEADRSKRIAELMDNAVTFQSQQRYEDALGQLDSLLTLDPLNNQALILKQTLEDMVGFRRQLETQRESDKERVSTLRGTDQATIPYAEELKHPKDWREIIASPFRKPEPLIGRTEAEAAAAANAAVDKQLDEIVDLSQLTPETPFGEAIEVLKNSVDPPLKIFVNWRDLYDNADIDQTTPIHMDTISAIQLRKAFEFLLEAVSGGFANINFVVESGVIKIATAESLPSKMETLVYDVTDLIGRPADFYAQTGGTITAPTAGQAGTEQLGAPETMTRDQIVAEATQRAEQLRQLIQQTISPTSWVETGGEGSITVYEPRSPRKLVIYQTREVHSNIEDLLEKLRKALGNQVAIEARFLLVGENFLEDIGLDVDFRVRLGKKAGGFGVWNFQQSSSTISALTETGVSGSLVPLVNPTSGIPGNNAMTTTGQWGNVPLLLTDLDVSILLRATQAHRDSKSLTAPKVTVLSGEMATFQVGRFRRYPSNVTFTLNTVGAPPNQLSYWTTGYTENSVVSGPLLNITPIITPDKKNVLLNIVTEMREFLGMPSYDIQMPAIGTTPAGVAKIPLPETEVSRVQTRVSVPDRATLLLGGQRMTVEVETEVGVPVLSKVPFLGRLFSNRSKVKDSQILLILVKPTIILREEKEAEAIAATEGSA